MISVFGKMTIMKKGLQLNIKRVFGSMFIAVDYDKIKWVEREVIYADTYAKSDF